MITRRIYKTLAVAPVVILVLAFIFRATLYWSFSVADGEPKGGGDIIEIFLFLLLLGSCLLSILYAVLIALVPRLRNHLYSINLLVIGILIPVIFWFLHPIIPRLL